MKKNGFTLIEMLGILMVLSVIILVSVPSILSTNKKAKESQMEDAKETLYMAAETYVEIDKDRKARLKKNGYYFIKLTDLVSEGLISSSMKNPGTDFEDTVSEGSWWVQANYKNGNTTYKLVNENPYIEEENDSLMVYTVLSEKSSLIRDKNDVNRYIYTDSNPNNYISFNNETWRIISLESDKTIKIIKNDFLEELRKFGTDNNISTTSDLIKYLNNDYLNDLTPAAQSMIIKHNFNNGAYDFSSLSSTSNLNTLEKTKQIKLSVGLINISDYISASENDDCSAYNSYSMDSDPCVTSNYLYKNSSWWTINPSSSGIVTINSDEGLQDTSASTEGIGVRPVIYLNSNITIVKGSGTNSSPYVVSLIN
jgi:competence protein ComGC